MKISADKAQLEFRDKEVLLLLPDGKRVEVKDHRAEVSWDIARELLAQLGPGKVQVAKPRIRKRVRRKKTP
jgi:hypothetical protein